MERQIIWIFRILFAGFLGSFVGYERHSKSKEAGVKTHTIVALASALMMILSKYGFGDALDFDASRIASQVVTGIGFLGTGIIFVKNDTVQGLTTAAGVWATCGIGMCIGAGMYGIGIFTAILIVIIQTLVHHSSRMGGIHISLTMKLLADNSFESEELVKQLEDLRISVQDLKIIPKKNSDHWKVEAHMVSYEDLNIQKVIDHITKVKGIIEIGSVD